MNYRTTANVVFIIVLSAVLTACSFSVSTGGNQPAPAAATPSGSPIVPAATPKAAAPAPTPTNDAANRAPAAEQPAERPTDRRIVVSFPAGETGTEFEDTIAPGERHIYVVKVRRGQYLGAQTYADEDVPLTVRRRNGPALEVPAGNVKWGGEVPESGDYEIVVGEAPAKLPYRISINAE